MKLIAVFCGACLAAVTVSSAGAEQVVRIEQGNNRLPVPPKGVGYKEYRKTLIRAGYKPVPQPHTKDQPFCGTAYNELGEADLCVSYPEVLYCAGTGVRPCNFAFIRLKGRRRMIVSTYGEQNNLIEVGGLRWADRSDEIR